jgi:YD repeat-containing protein
MAALFFYDALDDMTQVTQGSSQTRTFGWNMRGWMVSASNPEVGNVATTWNYDNNGNPIYREDPRGLETCYQYDTMNRLTWQVYYTGSASGACSGITNNTATPSVTYSYDSGVPNAHGRLVTVSSSAAVDKILGYDELGRVTGSSQAIGGGSALSFGYTYKRGDVRAGSLVLKVRPARFGRHPEDPLGRVLIAGFEQAFELFAHDAVSRQFGPQVVAPAFEAVGDVFKEQQAQDNVLVLRSVDLPTKGVGGLPESVGVVEVAGHYVVIRHQSSASLSFTMILVEAAEQLWGPSSCLDWPRQN